MHFNEAEDDDNNKLFCRRVSEGGTVEIGVYRVMYGYRVRAGFVGDMSCRLDWCAGANWIEVESLYTMCLQILMGREESSSCFADIPPCSTVKPYRNDHEFLRRVAALIPPESSGMVTLDSTPIVASHSALWM
jgi:hypothetical protein